MLIPYSWNMNAMTPLLKLPQEVKDQIWSFVCSGKSIQIYPDYNKSTGQLFINHHLCLANNSLEHVCAGHLVHFHGDNGIIWTQHNRYLPGAGCESDEYKNCDSSSICYGRGSSEALMKGPVINLPLIQTCRQLYHEAILRLYNPKTFCFDSPIALEHFFLPTPHLSNFRRISLLLQFCHFRAAEWRLWQVGSQKLTSTASSLRDLRIVILTFNLSWDRDGSLETFASTDSDTVLSTGDDVRKGLGTLASLSMNEARDAILNGSLLETAVSERE